jgi:outer membrane receptor for ferrienterochelin and colicins
MSYRLNALGLALGAAVFTLPAVAQEGSVDDLDLVKLLNVQVSTATKTAENLDEAPAVTTVVTREDIERWGYQSVGEVLHHTLGFYVTDDHILPNVAVRGVTGGLRAESGVIKVMIDGRSVAYRSTSGNWLGVELIPLGSIQQIEIIRGPASALYGADAFLGVVNIITLRGDEARPVRAKATVGVTGANLSTRLDVVGGATFGKFDLLLGFAGELSDRSGLTLPAESPAPILPSSIGTRREALNLERRSLSLQTKLGYQTQGGHLNISAYGSGLTRGGDFAHWAQLTNGRTDIAGPVGTTVALAQLRLNVDGLLQLTPELGLALQSTYFRGGLLPADRVDVASNLFYVERKESYSGVDAVAEARWIPSPRFNLVAGTEAVVDEEFLGAPHRISYVTRLAVQDGGDQQIRLVNLGAFVSSNVKVIDPWLKLTGGVRYDHHNRYGTQLNGRLGVTSRLSPSVVAKLLYGSAFKAPSPYLLYGAPLRLDDVIGNPGLKPQRIHTLEYQMSWKPSRFWGLSSGVAYSWLLDKAEFTRQDLNQAARNVSSQRSLSWETRADVRHYEDYQAYASFEIVHSRRDLGEEGYQAELVGEENTVYPHFIARAGGLVDVPLFESLPLDFSVEAMLVGPRRASDATLLNSGGDVSSFPTYVMLDAALASRALYLIPGHESRIALRAKNLLMTTGPDPGFSGFEYPLAPLEVFLELQHLY